VSVLVIDMDGCSRTRTREPVNGDPVKYYDDPVISAREMKTGRL
jgi:hypothetical protein